VFVCFVVVAVEVVVALLAIINEMKSRDKLLKLEKAWQNLKFKIQNLP